jgi:hypothetical protein
VREFWNGSGLPLFVSGEDQRGTFNRAAARNAAVTAAGGAWDFAILADADSLVELERLRGGLALAEATGLPVLPHSTFAALTRGQTLAALAGGTLPRIASEPGRLPVGGCIIVPRAVWDRVGGYDERFVGWGYEDTAFWSACGGARRTPGFLWHLWHPIAPEVNPRHQLHARNRRLAAEYGRDMDTGAWPTELIR